jgi:hypothetical protein
MRKQEYFKSGYFLSFTDSSCIVQLHECFTRQKPAVCVFTIFLIAKNTTTSIGLAAKLYRQILLDGAWSRRTAVAAVLGATKDIRT